MEPLQVLPKIHFGFSSVKLRLSFPPIWKIREALNLCLPLHTVFPTLITQHSVAKKENKLIWMKVENLICLYNKQFELRTLGFLPISMLMTFSLAFASLQPLHSLYIHWRQLHHWDQNSNFLEDTGWSQTIYLTGCSKTRA